MKFICDTCNYLTDDQANFNKHKKSKKHTSKCNKLQQSTNNVLYMTPERLPFDSQKSTSKIVDSNIKDTKNEYICDYCSISFSKSCNLSRHLKNCKTINKIENELNTKIKELEYENKLKLLQEKLKSSETEKTNLISKYHILESKCNLLENENDFHKQLVSAAGGILQKSMNTMSYLLLNYDNAPQLQTLSDYSLLSKDNTTLIRDLVHFYNKGTFDKFIGDFIVKQYKKNDPELQALWSSDTDRLNYFIKELVKHKNLENIGNNNSINLLTIDKTKWIMDKKGIKVSNYIIEPLLEYIQKIGINYLDSINRNIDNFPIDQTTKLINDMQTIAEINCGIKNKSLAKNINKYIAPYFYLNKDNNKN